MPKSAATKPTIPKFECSVCCTEAKESIRNKKVQCTGCDYIVCSGCQKQYGKVECMNCRARFPNAFAMDTLGITFVTHTARQNMLRELIQIQKTELETVGELVEWTKVCRDIQKNLRFGIHISFQTETGQNTRLPPKPTRNRSAQVLCQCPVNDCRGAIVGEICNICSTQVCTECLFEKKENHVCDPNVVESVKDIKASTKPCPRCSTLIHKTEGCDHMNCTNCGTHFSWEHGNILSNSSNYHYRNRMIRQQVNGQSNDEADDNQLCAVSMEHDRIPQDALRELLLQKQITIDEHILETLYEVTKAVRYLKRTEYSDLAISEKTREKYDEYQVKYAMNEISEKVWEQHVYKTHIKQQSYEMIAGILHIYIANMDGVQSELYNAVNQQECTHDFIESIVMKINQLTDIINENIREIHDEYDTLNPSILVIRKVGQTDIGYCSKQRIIKEKTDKKQTKKSFKKDEYQGDSGDGGDNPQNIVLEKSDPPEKKQIELYPYQIEHVQRLESYLDKYHFGIDLSPLGTGKTYTAAKVFQNRSLQHIVTISPPSVKTKWLEVNGLYSLGCDSNLTYGEITGKRFTQPKCEYLLRNDYRVPVMQEDGTTRMIDKYNYTVTDSYKQLVANGLLLVLDEFQHLKNESAQTEACEIMIRCIYDDFKKGGRSRVLLLSGSPIDKYHQAVRLFKTLGIMRHDKIVSGYQYAGINEIEDYINENFKNSPRNNPIRNDFIATYRESYIRTRLDRNNNEILVQNAFRCELYAYRLFLNVIKPHASSAMDLRQIQNTGIILHKYNGNFRLNDERNQEKVTAALEDLNKINDLRMRIREQRRTNGDPNAGSMMAQVVRALTVIETSKIDTFHRLARKDLEFDPCKKVVIGVNYSATIKDLASLLAEYNPLIIDGSKSVKARRAILDKFQAPTSEYRVLIGNIAVISTGIDLDDKHGEFPRVCYVSPNYNTIHIYQLGHRFLRGLDTKSDTDIYMVYSDNRYERRMMESLMSKGQIMKSVTREQADAGIVFPCDYQAYVEPDEVPVVTINQENIVLENI